MARMHSRKRGQAASTRPAKRTKSSWVRYQPREAELLITKLAKEGNSPSKIGLLMRDAYGIPDVKAVVGKSVSTILKQHNMQSKLPEDLTALLRKAALVQGHMERNKQDMTALRGMQLTEAKIKRLVKYYKRTEVLGRDWKYDTERLKMFLE
ncbi:30S ribosomal protein S15 [Candidatus Woesearchaeota archaeon]|nr:30S ribosomal protein S15 [Candidatus Woesearchaeota archaeon]